jgi:Transposase DDE domain/Haloacid dehalogenase-like hydrolase
MKMLADTRSIQITDADKKELTEKFSTMPPHRELPAALRKVRDAGFRLFTLTDNLPEVQTRQLEHGGIVDLFERRFSADGVKQHKPSRQAYAYVERELGVRRAPVGRRFLSQYRPYAEQKRDLEREGRLSHAACRAVRHGNRSGRNRYGAVRQCKRGIVPRSAMYGCGTNRDAGCTVIHGTARRGYRSLTIADGLGPLLAPSGRESHWMAVNELVEGFNGQTFEPMPGSPRPTCRCCAWRSQGINDMNGFVVRPRRWVVERTFSWFGRDYRFANDFENLASTRQTFVSLAIQLAIRWPAKT